MEDLDNICKIEHLIRDYENGIKSIKIKEHNIKVILNEEYTNLIPLFNQLVDAGKFSEAMELIKYNKHYLSSLEKTASGIWVPKQHFPEGIDLNAKGEFLTDKKEFEGFKKWGSSFLNKEVAEEVFYKIEYSKNEKIMEGSRPKLAILFDMFLKKEVKDGRRILCSGQGEKNRARIKGKYCDGAYYLTGEGEINVEEAKYLIEQFQKRGIGKVVNGNLGVSIKVDLRGLELNKNGQVQLTDEAIYTETKAFMDGDFNFKKSDKFGIPIKDASGKRTCYTPNKSGMFRCFSYWGSDSYVGGEDLGDSYPYGRVAFAKSRSD